MKRLEISRLMDEYTDTEVFPEGGSAAGTQAVKERVLANAKAPARKKRMPAKKKLLIAAALAAVLVVLVGAGFPYIQHQLIGGALTFEQTSDSRITSLVHHDPVLYLEDGRIFLTQNDGQHIDITDFISEDTPYIYDGSDPDTEMTYYIIMGGTPECYGYFEWIITPNPFDDGDGPAPAADGNSIRTTRIYAFEWITYEQGRPVSGGSAGFDMDVVVWEDEMEHHPWLLAGLNELGIPCEYAPNFEN